MNEAAMTKRLSELIETITSSPLVGQEAKSSPQGVYLAGVASREASLDSSVDHLRLQVKYLLFDLEATRRENRYLRQMLESRHRRGPDGCKGDDPDIQ